MFSVVNSSFPELTHLAAELANQDLLSAYVRPFASFSETPERLLRQVPVLGRPISRLVMLRAQPDDLDGTPVVQSALGYDLAQALVSRSPLPVAVRRRLFRQLIYRRGQALGRSARRHLGAETGVIASRGAASPVFSAAKARGIVTILDYPSAHYGFVQEYLEEEAALQPQFASSIDDYNHSPWFKEKLDFEIASADLILVGSSFARDTFVAQGVSGSKLRVVPYGVSLEMFTPSAPPHNRKGIRALFVGRISQGKGISYLLEAARLAFGADDSLTLIGAMIGDGRFLKGYSGLVRYEPRMPQPALREWYRSSDVFVFPTLTEGMGLVVLEAMASGLPVITTANGPGDVVRDGIDGFIVPPRSAEAIAERLNTLKRDRELRLVMGASARQRALEFSWGAYRDRAVGVIKQHVWGS